MANRRLLLSRSSVSCWQCCFTFILLLSYNIHSNQVTVEAMASGFSYVGNIVSSMVAPQFSWIYCRVAECCTEKWVSLNITGLKYDLSTKLHGQHLVSDVIIKAVKSHLSKTVLNKALVLSFHGWTGCGKNFVSSMIVNNLFYKGLSSKYVHMFIATHHFPHRSEVEIYKQQLREWIRGNVTICDRSVFIFDEVEKLPPGVLDVIFPFIDFHPQVDGVDYRKSIFIFLSNTAGGLITEEVLSWWKSGKKREKIGLAELEQIIIKASFNSDGGLWHSRLIEHHLIDAFVPFLPLERDHVKLCARDYLLKRKKSVQESVISEVTNQLDFYPPSQPIFSKSGCKRVAAKVDLLMHDEL